MNDNLYVNNSDMHRTSKLDQNGVIRIAPMWQVSDVQSIPVNHKDAVVKFAEDDLKSRALAK